MVGVGGGESLTFYTAPICPTATLWDSTIYPHSWSPSSLALVQRTQAGLRPTPHISWPLGVRPSAKLVPQCAASLAPGGYDQPCGPIESLFLSSPACILDGRAQLYSSELSYSYLMGLPSPRKNQLIDHLFCRQKYF